ncbi:MAG: T9SS type A sorting domain-containing protein [Bacteroidota bacterium]
MKKYILFIAIPILFISLASLTSTIEELKIPIQQSKGTYSTGTINNIQATTKDACNGCHGGGVINGGTGGYVIIIYEDGKTTTDFDVFKGDTRLILMNSSQNTLTPIRQSLYNQKLMLQISSNIDASKFVKIHGIASESVLSHMTVIDITSEENKSVELNKSYIAEDFQASFNNTQMQLDINAIANSTIQVSLYDMSGKSYLTQSSSVVAAGDNQLQFETKEALLKGIYIVKIVDAAGITITKKVFVF